MHNTLLLSTKSKNEIPKIFIIDFHANSILNTFTLNLFLNNCSPDSTCIKINQV